MSHFNDFETAIDNEEGLIRALCRCTSQTQTTFRRNQIESHKDAQNLYGYQSDRREQKANVIIRRQYVGRASNDLGFVKNEESGTYNAIISDYDTSHYNKHWLSKLYTYYNVERSKMALEEKGIEYAEMTDEKGRIQLRAKFKTSGTTSRIKVRS